MTDSTPAIFLDMDETLLHYTYEWVAGGVPAAGGFILLRPHVTECLRKLAAWADVYVFSAGSPEYVEAALKATRLHVFVDGFFSSRVDNFLPTKDRLWILVDDLPAMHENTCEKLRQLARWDDTLPTPAHVHKIPPWTGDPADRALAHLPVILEARLDPPLGPWEPH